MGVKSRGNYTTMSKERYEKIKWSGGLSLCNSCGGEMIEKLVEDEVYSICQDCGSVG